ncbi:MAG: tetratricopeptide repeat protein [bacterium]
MSAFKGLNNVELFIYLIVLYTLIYLIIIHLFNNSLYKISLYFYDEGLSRFNKEKYKSALKYVFIARLFFDCLEIHEIKGKIYLNLDYYKRAVSEFLKCLNYTDQPYIYEYIAGAFTELNNEKKALEYRLQAYYISEKESKELNYLDYQTNLWELWRLHFKQKKHEKSLNFIKEYIELYPNDCEAYNAAGYSASEINKELEYNFYQQSYRCCQRNSDDKDKLVTTLWDLALASYDLNKTSDTINYLNELISLQPQNIRAKYDLGKVYFDVQDYQKSIQMFKSIINNKNKFTKKSILYLILTYIKSNNIDKANKFILEHNIKFSILSSEEIKKEFSEDKLEELKKFLF